MFKKVLIAEDFESFNISKRAKSIVGITNKHQGKQTGGSDDDI